jgi:SAM-dependent methyltransferase
MHKYGLNFYRSNASLAVRSARRIVPKLMAVLPVRSVVDFGCGRAAWLSVWADAGIAVAGIDAANIDQRQLLIDPACFWSADLSEPIHLGKQFDLIQSLEVAEHLPPPCAESFVDTLVAHGSCVLFSAATPGQGGEHHVNEQPLEYWRAIFRTRGYSAVDYLRPIIVNDQTIEPWYRYNIMLYIKDDMISNFSDQIQSRCVSDQQRLHDYRSFPYRLQNALIRQLPAGTVDRISRVKWLLKAHLSG